MTGLTAELVVDGREPRTPALAPDGRLLCYVLAPVSRAGDHLDTELWLVDTDGAVASRRATADTATESRPRWSADSETLFFLSDRAERGTPQLHGLTLADGTVTTLTSWRAGVIDHLPLADPNLVALLAEDEPTEQDARRARDRDDAIVVGEREPRARLRLLDLRTGRVTTPNVFGDRHVVELRQRPDGGPLAVLTAASADNDYGPRTGQLHLFDPTTGTTEDLGPVGVDARSLAWWPGEDGWHLGYIALTPPVLQAGTAVFDLAVDSRVLRNRTAGLPMCPTELCQTDAAPLVVFADGLNTTLARLDPTGLTTLSQHPGRLDDLTTTPTGEKIAVLTGTRYQPPNVHIGPPTGPLRRITNTRPELDGIALGTQQPLAYRAADGLDLDGLLVLPVGQNRVGRPVPAGHDRARRPVRSLRRSLPVVLVPQRAVAGRRRLRGVPAQPARRPGPRPRVRRQRRRPGRAAGVDRHPDRHRPARRRGRRRPRSAGHRRLEPRRLHVRLGRRPDRPVPRRAGRRRRHRLGHARRDRGERPVRSRARWQHRLVRHRPAPARRGQPDLLRQPRSALRCSSCTAPRTPTSPSGRPCTSTGRCATSASSTSS